MVTMVALQVLATQGSEIGWTSPITLGLGAIAVVVGALFFKAETRARNPFVNFALFRNSTYTGATISNFLLNGVAGMLLVSMMLVQLGGGLSAQEAGMLTLGYAIAIVAFIRVGEKLLQRFGARKPMIWGSLIVGLSIAMLMPTNLLIGQYKILAVAAYTLFGLGLAFYATPSTDAALSNLPDDQAGSGSGIYKMASSLGASFGVAISAAIFTALSAESEIDSLAGGRDHVCRSSGQRGRPPGRDDRVGLQSAHGRGGHRVDHAHGPQRPQTRRHAMNALVNEFKGRLETIRAWRHHLHKHPELSLEESETAKYIADLVRSWGYEVVEGVGKHGVVASLTAGTGSKSIGLRADTDALPIQEDNNLPYKSEVAGVSHLCGHDGHTAMLLAAGEYLARSRNFNGTVRLIFQPAEEIMAGGPAMIEDGLFERWPVDAVFGMHNMPGLELGKLHFRDGAMMAAVDNWEIELTGKGSHGSMPELSIDPVVAGSSLVMALQTIVSRNVSPHNSAVVTVGAFISGNAGNVIAQSAILRLSVRTTTPEDRTLVLGKVRSITKAQAESFGCTYAIREGVPGAVLVNDPAETAKAAAIAREAFGDQAVMYPGPSYLGSEDFAFMLQKKQGTYCLLGNGDTPMVHHPQYVFNDDILPVGAAYWVALTEQYLREP